MGQPATDQKKITLIELWIYAIRKIIAANKFGLTRMNLAGEITSLSRVTNVPEYFGSKRILDKLLDDYVLNGELVNGTLTVGGSGLSWIMPTHNFKFAPDEAMEKFIKQNTARKEEVTIRDKTFDERIRWGIVGL